MPTARTTEGLEHRLRTYQACEATLSTIVRLHRNDRELFYELYALPTNKQTPEWLRNLQAITHQLHRMARHTLSIDEQHEADYAVLHAGNDELTITAAELDAL